MGKIMRKLLLVVLIIILVIININWDSKTDIAKAKKDNKPQHEQINKNVGNLDVMKSNNSDCTDSVFVCELTTLHVGDPFAYSDYIWAIHGQAIEFGGMSTGEFQIGFWVESDDGSFISHVDTVISKGEDTLTFLAPFDGFYRVVIQNGSKNDSGSGYAYIKDTWPK